MKLYRKKNFFFLDLQCFCFPGVAMLSFYCCCWLLFLTAPSWWCKTISVQREKQNVPQSKFAQPERHGVTKICHILPRIYLSTIRLADSLTCRSADLGGQAGWWIDGWYDKRTGAPFCVGWQISNNDKLCTAMCYKTSMAKKAVLGYQQKHAFAVRR